MQICLILGSFCGLAFCCVLVCIVASEAAVVVIVVVVLVLDLFLGPVGSACLGMPQPHGVL